MARAAAAALDRVLAGVGTAVQARSSEGSRRGALQPSSRDSTHCPSLRYSRGLRTRRSLVSRSSSATPNPLGRSSPAPQGPASSPLSPSIRSFSPGPLDDEQEDSLYPNAICYPEIVLNGPLDEDTSAGELSTLASAEPLFCDWPMDPSTLGLVAFPDSLPYMGEAGGAGEVQGTMETGLAQHDFWREGAVAAVMKAEENYRRAWRDLQAAERRLQSTRQVAAELDAVPPQQSWLGEGSRGVGQAAALETLPVDLGFEDGVWCIEACRPDAQATQPGQGSGDEVPAASISGAILDAEGAILRSRSALDKASADLVARLQEEKELQGQVMDRHIDALDQGAQYQVARWLVEEMDAVGLAGELEAEGSTAAAARDALGLAVPLDLDLAMRGYDEHAMRFLCHLPYDQVLKIRTIPPSEKTKSLSSASPASPSFDTTLHGSLGSGEDSAHQGVARQAFLIDPEPRGPGEGTVEWTFDELSTSPGQGGPGVTGWEGPLQTDAVPASPPAGSLVKRSGMKKGGRYHTKLVLLGCCICSVAAYMVANFELLALAKDVSVILAAMSLAFIAAQFVWRSGGSSGVSAAGECSSTSGAHGVEETWQGSSYGLGGRTGGSPGLGESTLLPSMAAMYRRTPSWDQIIWLLGGSAVVLSLSTMIALACKAAQAGLTALSVMACSLVVGVLPNGASRAASAALLASQGSTSGLVRQVSTSLWLVLGGGVLSSGVECLGSAAAWAMLLLCVAFSIASAPVCIASSTSRRVNELLALARHDSSEH